MIVERTSLGLQAVLTYGNVRRFFAQQDRAHGFQVAQNLRLQRFNTVRQIFHGEELLQVVTAALIDVTGVKMHQTRSWDLHSTATQNVKLDGKIGCVSVGYGRGGLHLDQIVVASAHRIENIGPDDNVIVQESPLKNRARSSASEEPFRFLNRPFQVAVVALDKSACRESLAGDLLDPLFPVPRSACSEALSDAANSGSWDSRNRRL